MSSLKELEAKLKRLETKVAELLEVKTYTPKTSLVEVVQRDAAFGIVEGSHETTQKLKEENETTNT